MPVSLVLGLGLERSCPWPREVLSSKRLSLALASDFFCVLGLGLEPCVLDSTSVENVNTKSELKRSSLKTKETLSLILKPPAKYNTMQSFLLSLVKASKQKGLAYIKLIAGVRTCDSKKIVTVHSMPAKFNCPQRLQF